MFRNENEDYDVELYRQNLSSRAQHQIIRAVTLG